MKNEKVVYLNGEFVNFKGETQKVILCAVSVCLQDSVIVSGDIESVEGVDGVVVNKALFIGVSIQNPKDTYNEEIGKKIAYSKAKTTGSIITTNYSGFINSETVNCILNNLLNYIKKDPGVAIAGYDKALKKFKTNAALVEEWKKLPKEKQTLYETLAKTSDEEITTARKFFK